MAEFDLEILDLVAQLSASAREKAMMVATAESCTGGLIAGAITSLAGSSAVFDRGIVSYSNEAKQELLAVPKDILATHGAVSHETACAMVHGLFTQSQAAIGVSVTGVAGPGGGSDEKPVGLVYVGHGLRGGAVDASRHLFDGDRPAIRRATIVAALTHIDRLLATI
ncbi:MAG: CinA family protein [Pseudomonadota bacterium]